MPVLEGQIPMSLFEAWSLKTIFNANNPVVTVKWMKGGYLERDEEGVRCLVSTVPCTQFSPERLCVGHVDLRLGCLWTSFSYLF